MRFTKIEVKFCESAKHGTFCQSICLNGDRQHQVEVSLTDYAILYPQALIEIEFIPLFHPTGFTQSQLDELLSRLGMIILSIKADEIAGIISAPDEIKALAEFYGDFCAAEGELDVQFLLDHTISQTMFDRLQRHT